MLFLFFLISACCSEIAAARAALLPRASDIFSQGLAKYSLALTSGAIKKRKTTPPFSHLPQTIKEDTLLFSASRAPRTFTRKKSAPLSKESYLIRALDLCVIQGPRKNTSTISQEKSPTGLFKKPHPINKKKQTPRPSMASHKEQGGLVPDKSFPTVFPENATHFLTKPEPTYHTLNGEMKVLTHTGSQPDSKEPPRNASIANEMALSMARLTIQ